jgi:hypothetical protein
VLGAIEVRKFLCELIHVFLVGSFYPPLPEQLGVQQRFL